MSLEQLGVPEYKKMSKKYTNKNQNEKVLKNKQFNGVGILEPKKD